MSNLFELYKLRRQAEVFRQAVKEDGTTETSQNTYEVKGIRITDDGRILHIVFQDNVVQEVSLSEVQTLQTSPDAFAKFIQNLSKRE